jgi:hypothetical protein
MRAPVRGITNARCHLTIVVSAFMLALVAMSFAFAGGAVPVAIPIAVIVIGLMLWMGHRLDQ